MGTFISEGDIDKLAVALAIRYEPESDLGRLAAAIRASDEIFNDVMKEGAYHAP